MRITAVKREETRQRILDAARTLFRSPGFERTTTRDLADAAGIAAGTLFNYFPSKEALARQLLADAAGRGRDAFERERRPGMTLDELLFAHAATLLRMLRPMHGFAGRVLEGAAREADDAFRADHLESVRAILAEAGADPGPADPLVMHLYWTLLLGVLSFWASDNSPNQEDTLALLDRSMRLFAASLSQDPSRTGGAE